MMRGILRLAYLVALFAAFAAARGPVYVVLWFDTEDYIEPAADDAALRLARDLERLGVRATFKIVGEKARSLEARGRHDVIRALSLHDIGYHAENHSIPPAPAVYLRPLGWLDGAAEFERREGRGLQDVRRIFGVNPSCYGQPGSSWGPQSYRALLKMGVPVYLDEGSQVGLDEQPFWFGGMLHVFGMGRYVMRASLDPAVRLETAFARFDRAVEELAERGGGVISIYYHPTEFVTLEFWDAVNFSRGAMREPDRRTRPRLRTPADAERCYGVLARYVEHARSVPGVRFVTARELPQLYQSAVTSSPDLAAAAAHLRERLTFLSAGETTWSAADLLVALLGMTPRAVEGPLARRASTLSEEGIPRPAFERAKSDAVSYIGFHQRLPEELWIGSARLALPDFAATLAGDDGASAVVKFRRGNLAFERYVSTDAARAFNWVIHPEAFQAPELLELARLQAWTLKPARLR